MDAELKTYLDALAGKVQDLHNKVQETDDRANAALFRQAEEASRPKDTDTVNVRFGKGLLAAQTWTTYGEIKRLPGLRYDEAARCWRADEYPTKRGSL